MTDETRPQADGCSGSVEAKQPAAPDVAISAEEAKKRASAAAREAKAAKKAERAAQRGKPAAATEGDAEDPLRHCYGDTPLIASQSQSGRTWSRIDQLTRDDDGKQVLLRGRLHTVRSKGKSCFIVLRQRMATIQVVLFVNDETVSKGMVKYAAGITRESIVDVEGDVHVPKAPIEGCSQSQVEVTARSVRCISRAAPLPFEVIDAARTEEQMTAEDARFAAVAINTRLDSRFIDLRTPANQAIFRIQSAVCQLFREALLAEGFQEIHTPKLIAGASEGGAAVFRLDYLGRPACLAQSPQLYKQMAVSGDLDRVFEIGPVFRAEKSDTHRHLCEFTGLDMEMVIQEHYFEVVRILGQLFVYMFNGLQKRCALDLEVIRAQFPCEPLRYCPETVSIPFEEGIRMLQEAGHEVDPLGDLNTATERELGRLVREKHGTDFYVLHHYPLAVRPFYTMPDLADERYSNSFDVFIRGEEIISGAQRVHDPSLLASRASALGVPLESIQSYIDSFKYGAPPHGGFGVGMERVVMLFLGLDNIRRTSLFPRDLRRLTP